MLVLVRRMPRKANEILVRWLESKDVGKTNRVNVKHVVGSLEGIEIGKEVVVKLNARRYRSTVMDLLDWSPPKKKNISCKRSKRTKGKDQEPKKRKTTEKVLCNKKNFLTVHYRLLSLLKIQNLLSLLKILRD